MYTTNRRPHAIHATLTIRIEGAQIARSTAACNSRAFKRSTRVAASCASLDRFRRVRRRGGSHSPIDSSKTRPLAHATERNVPLSQSANACGFNRTILQALSSPSSSSILMTADEVCARSLCIVVAHKRATARAFMFASAGCVGKLCAVGARATNIAARAYRRQQQHDR